MPASALALCDQFQKPQFDASFVGSLNRPNVGARSRRNGLLTATEGIAVSVYEHDGREPQHALIGHR
ncbi:hypothetical protein BKG82_07840 [Mycobacteroides chelonae]|uniref:Uncharacterized protein n=1 Tax=Mycobacteroides chelonae TaxID=1774 RepID=A0A1S1LXA7_MYCCH|nr:hypothetical protein BKG82_07840 [Mycobacteroides chelonae]